MKSLTGKMLLRFILPFCISMSLGFYANAQCTLGPGDLVFTGFNLLDDGTDGSVVDDSFSFLLFKDVKAGDVIYFTDLGWTDANAFQAQNKGITDAVLKWTADVNYPAGTEIIIYCKYTLQAKDLNGVNRGTVTVQQESYNTQFLGAVPAEHMSLAEISGDQIFAFTGSIASPNFLAGISVNRKPTTLWDASLAVGVTDASRSKLPAQLATGAQNLGIAYIDPSDPGSNAAPVARYKKTAGLKAGLPSALLTAINNTANWEIKSDGNIFIPLLTNELYTITGVTLTAQPVDRLLLCQGAGTTFSVTAANVCGYQWQVSTDGGGIFNNIANGGVYSNVTTSILSISSTTGLNNNKYRVVLSGTAGLTSNAATLTLLNPTLVFNTATVPAGIYNTPYTQDIHISSGGNGVYTYALVTAGTLPAGITLNSTTGLLSGTPTQAGTFNFSVKATDGCPTGNTATQTYSLVINKGDQTISFANTPKVYGDPAFTLTANASSGLPITYSSADPAVATILGNTVTITGFGTTVITANQAGNINFNAAPTVQQTLSVSKKAITVTANSGQTKVYGVADPALNYSVTAGGPLVGLDSFTGLLDRDPGENVGNYAINIGTLTAGNNYVITFSGANFSITAKPVTLALNAIPQITKPYDNSNAATLAPANYTLTGVLISDAVTVSGTATYDTKDAGAGKTITANTFVLAGAQKDNYSLTTTTATTTGDITAIPVTLALNAIPLVTKAYDNSTTATLAAANYTLTGVLGADAVSVSGTANYDTKDVGAGKTITASTFALAGAQKDNYSLTTTTATTTGEITALPITLALNAIPLVTKAYDNTNTATLAAGNYTLSGVLGTDAVTVSGTATYDTKDVGAGKTITAGSFALAGAQKDNYSLTTTTATTTGDITAIPVTLALNATPLVTKAYDNTTTATLAAANYTLTGVLGADAVSVSGTANYDTKDVGVGKTITAGSFALAGAQKDNYSLTTTTATTTGEITAIPVTLALNAIPLVTKAYDNTTTATLAAANYTLTGVLGADAVSVSGTANYDTKDVGVGKTITAGSFTLAGAQKDNYSLTTTTATTTGDITAIPVTLALNAIPLVTKAYDNSTTATLAPANYTLTGVLGADAVSVSGTANYDTKDVGAGKTITANTFALTGAQKDNYSLTTTTATTTGNITAIPVTLALNAIPLVTKAYDNSTTATLAAANYTLTGVLGADAVSVSGTANYDTKDVGAGKTITAGSFALAGAQKDNYSLTTTTATTTGDITAIPVTLALNAIPLVTKAYDNTTTATLAAANYTLTGVLGADAVSVSGTANYDTKDVGAGKTITAGSFALAGAQKDNYSLTTTTATTTGDITATPVTLALNAIPLVTKAYDNSTTATLAPANYTLTGVLGADAVSVSGTANYDTKDVGASKTITAGSFTLTGAQKDNYSLTTTTATTTGDITALPITLALNAIPLVTKAYDNSTTATLAAANYTLTGVLGTDAVTVSGTANYDTKDVGAGKTITANTFALAGAQKDNYSLTTTTATTTGEITALPITLALNAIPLVTKAYDNTTTATLATGNYTLSGVLGTDAVTVSGTATYDTKDVGTGKTITAGSFTLAGAQKDNYSLTTTTATITGEITAIPLTLALNATPLITKPYDNTTTATLVAGNYTLSGVLGTDAVTVSGTATYDTKDVGTGKTITANTFALTGAQKDNYSLTTITATITGDITAIPVTLALNATPLVTKAYDNSTTATLAAANYTLTGLLGADAVTVSGTANYDTKDVGAGKTITANTFALAGAQKDNYSLTTTTATTTGEITALPITLALNATPLVTKAYDNTTTATLAAANYTLTGVLGADAVSVSGTANYDTKDVGAGKTITANTFALAGAQKDNYSLTTTTATTTGDITAIPVTLALNAIPLVTKAYDNSTTATLAAANYTLTGILGADVVSVSGTANYDTKDVGAGKTITANTFALTGAQKDNYSLTTTTATTTGEITALPITLTLNATPLVTKAYDNSTMATLAAANYTLNGILGADAVSVSGTANYDTKDVGAGKTITANTFVLAGAQKDNYSLTTTTATTTGDITAIPVTLALNAIPLVTKAYDNTTTATLAPANYTLTGVLGADVVSVSGTANYDTKDAGTGKTITANTFVLAGAQKDNYSLTTTTATTTGDITAIPVTLTLNAIPLVTKAYDNSTTATLAPANYTLNGTLGADAVSVSGTANYDTKDVGAGKTITANTFVLAGAQKDNYSLTTTTATTTGDITAIPLTLVLNTSPLVTKAYDNSTTATLAPANYTLTGVLSTDIVTVSGTANYDTKDVGTGKTITAGSFALAGAQKDNYSLTTTTATTTGDITAIPLTLVLNASPLITKAYDNTTTATLAPANYTLNGVLGADAVTVSGTADYDTKNAGTGKTITAGTFALAGAQKDNYSLTTTTATTTGDITGLSVTLTLNASPLVTKPYDNSTTATLAAGNYTLTGVLSTDVITVTGTANYDTKDAGTVKTITANTFALAGAQKDNYSLTTTTATTTGDITAIPVTLTLNPAPLITKVYDGTATASLADGNYTLSNILGSDVVSVNGTASFDNKNAGTVKTVTANTFTLTGAQKDNYLLTTTTAATTGNIAQKTLTVKADDQTKFEGTPNPLLTLTYSGFINGEGINNLTTPPTAGTLATNASVSGTYDITVNGGSATNYAFNYVKGNLVIVPGVPESLILTAVPLYENLPAGTLAGTFSSTSANVNTTFTYTLVSGAGDTDNSAFTITGDQLKSAATFDFETKSAYQIRVRTTTQFGFSLEQQFTINITDVNEAPTLDPIANQTICATSSTQKITLSGITAGPESGQTTSITVRSDNDALFQNLSVNGTGIISYRINDGATGTATITVTVKDNGGTANGGIDNYSRNFTLLVNPLPVVNIEADKGNRISANNVEISKGETVRLTATGGTTYTWSANSSILSGQQTAMLTVRPRETTTYTVTAANANGCTQTQSFTLTVIDDLSKINATNILTPNGDGYNDKWIVENIDFYPNNEVKIFDKSGRPVYSKKGYDNSWDGMLNGSPLAEGTYYYIIDFGNNRAKFKGYITIVRSN